MTSTFFRGLRVWICAVLLVTATAVLRGSDWPEWRGPARTGVSAEKGLPDAWSPGGENLAWRAAVGGRSAPVVFGDRLYLQTSAGSGATLQERVICFNADTGTLLWEHKYNVFTSDVPPHRIAWASPAVDPATGHVFAFSGNGLLMSFSPDGKLLWERSLAEEFGMWTTHGGRVSSPMVDGKQLIVSGLMFLWGEHAGGAHRYVSFDTATGKANWISAPEGRPTDTIYANPFVADVDGMRVMFHGGSDGAMHAINLGTGEPLWNWKVSQRGLNTAALMVGSDVIITHSEENVGSNEMGMVAAIPANSKGTLTDKDARWIVRGVQAGYASPVSDGERLYVLDNGGVLFAFDVKTGARLWNQPLGTIAKASPLLADGKLYIGTENTGDAGGKFYIIRPHADRAEILDQDWLGTPQEPQHIIASPIAARGRIYLTTMDALYAIGPKGTSAGMASRPAPVESAARVAPAGAAPATLHVTPTEVILKPGESLDLKVLLFDAKGNAIGQAAETAWSLDGLKGTLDKGKFTADPSAGGQAGLVKATVGGVSGSARIRVVPDLPWTFDFDSFDKAPPAWWINATGKFEVRELDGNKVLVKLANNAFAFAKRTRPFFGPTDLSDYTIQADVRSQQVRRAMGDVGIVAQRYELVLFGNHKRLELQPWQPETERTVRVPYKWEPDTWYTMKLEVQTLDGGRVRARGKVWPKDQPEPAEWQIERIDPIGSVKGSPGIYADAMNSAPQGGSEMYYDNIRVYRNQK
ncbi:MAG TPA: PQQ-binding-like beta-propeller repeat protein [Vicinamibacterales bacterium]|nr:PQQ-binding-like beta-propeller repeat protein [Vicinamibacterales bacterium]